MESRLQPAGRPSWLSDALPNAKRPAQLPGLVPDLAEQRRVKGMFARNAIVRITETGRAVPSELFEHEVADEIGIIQAAQHSAMRLSALPPLVAATAPTAAR